MLPGCPDRARQTLDPLERGVLLRIRIDVCLAHLLFGRRNANFGHVLALDSRQLAGATLDKLFGLGRYQRAKSVVVDAVALKDAHPQGRRQADELRADCRAGDGWEENPICRVRQKRSLRASIDVDEGAASLVLRGSGSPPEQNRAPSRNGNSRAFTIGWLFPRRSHTSGRRWARRMDGRSVGRGQLRIPAVGGRDPRAFQTVLRRLHQS